MSANTSIEIARTLLDCCLRGEAAPDKLLFELTDQAAGADQAIAREASAALFRNLVEPLADRFEQRLCDAYAALFSRVIAQAVPNWSAEHLTERYARVRGNRHLQAEAPRVYVLSRVTLGADVAITSIVLDAAKKRFPASQIWFVGPQKNWELFAIDSRLRHFRVDYGRGGTLRERLGAGLAIDALDGIVIDPDSRLTQLGLLPVCPEERYLFFESRALGGDGNESLPEITKRWVADVLGVSDAAPYIAPDLSPRGGGVTVSLGVGDNPAKRVADPFEERLLAALAETGMPVLVDKGAGGEETLRVERVVARLGSPGNVQTWEGAFAPFAAEISRSRLYVGYDSAGQHVAAATGVPLVCVFGGFASERAFCRWRPAGSGLAVVVRIDNKGADEVLAHSLEAVDALLRTKGLRTKG